MNSLSRLLLAVALVAPMSLVPAGMAADTAASKSPGYVDLGSFAAPSSGGRFVEVNLPRNLLALAARFAAKEDPEAARLIGQIESVRVNVVGIEEANREELAKRATEIRGELESKGWQKIVTARENGGDVGVYIKLDAEQVIQGITVVVLDGKDEAVFINVVGSIRPEDLEVVADRLGIEPLSGLRIGRQG
jgi:hypothetical protein